VESWSLNGCVKIPLWRLSFFFLTHFRCNFLSKEDIKLLDDSRDIFLGLTEDMTSEKPKVDPNNPALLIGGVSYVHIESVSVLYKHSTRRK
jgi:hypothetical protein